MSARASSGSIDSTRPTTVTRGGSSSLVTVRSGSPTRRTSAVGIVLRMSGAISSTSQPAASALGPYSRDPCNMIVGGITDLESPRRSRRGVVAVRHDGDVAPFEARCVEFAADHDLTYRLRHGRL